MTVSYSSALRPLRLLAVALVALTSFLVLGSVATAQTGEDCYGGPVGPGGTVGVCGSSTSIPETPTSQPSVSPPTSAGVTTPPTVLGTSESRFAVTGGDVLGLVAIGGGAVAVGAALVVAARRRRTLEVA
ncbi:MAG: hypothetical protein H0U89_09450 [Acidimicrobiia bacterium]|nr:hypothetical protein [Acidimicrobiia bacterium]